MYVGPARSMDDVAAAQALAAQVFLPGTAVESAANHKAFIWNEPDFPGLDHVIIAADKDGVKGTIRIVPRTLRRGEERFAVAGISSVCVAESDRGKGLSRLLMNAALDQARGLHYVLTVLFARRAADHLYPRFDIWGLASYSEISIAPPQTSKRGVEPAIARPATVEDIAMLSQWHSASYGRCFGWFERSDAHWRFLLESARRRHLSVEIAEHSGHGFGYVVRSAERIVELGLGDLRQTDSLLTAVASSDRPILAALPPRHLLAGELVGRDVTISARRCEYGGHMVGILDRDAVSHSLAERATRHAVAIGLTPREERVDGVIMRWDGRKTDIEIVPPAGRDQLGLHTTARLLGARLAGIPEQSVLAPAESLDFQALDEF